MPSYSDLLPASDPRPPVLAVQGSASDGSRCACAWLIMSPGQDRALLSASVGDIPDQSARPWLALAALGRSLGFPARVCAVMSPACDPDSPPAEWADAIKASFSDDDMGKSLLRVCPGEIGTARLWPGVRDLNAAARVSLDRGEPYTRIIDRCPECGEYKVGECACASGFRPFPNLLTPAKSRHWGRNRILEYGLKGFSDLELDYTREIGACPECGGIYVPVDADGWLCASCGHKAGSGDARPVQAVRPGLPLPSRILAQAKEAFEGAWAMADAIRAERMDASGKLPWDAGVFLPNEEWEGIRRRLGGGQGGGMFNALRFAGSWRPTQDIVRVAPALLAELAEASLPEDLPMAAFRRLPAWCVWYDAPGIALAGQAYGSFFAMLGEADGILRLEMLFASEKGALASPPPLEIGGQAIGAADPGIRPALGILLRHLAGEPGEAKGGSARASAQRDRDGWRIMEPERPAVHELGAGAADVAARPIRRRGSAAERQGPRPHIRRAHWHRYWTGAGRSRLDLRWVPPCAVALGQDGE